MVRALFWFVGSLALVRVASGAMPEGEPPKPTDARSFQVSPALEPVPAFRFQLFPNAMQRRPGNSVPIYLRFAHERSAEDKTTQLNASSDLLKPGKFDLAKARAVVDRFPRLFREMDHAARRQTTDWSYTIEEERENIFGTLLSDVQETRGYHRLLCLKARVETEDGKFGQAMRTLETSFSLSDQIAQGPFLIHSLVAVASASATTDVIDELIQKPSAPSLYWALVSLPHPVINIRRGLDSEYALTELGFPELYNLEPVRGEPEFNARLSRVVDRFRELVQVVGKPNDPGDLSVASLLAKQADAKEFLTSRQLATSDELTKMAPSQILLLAIRGQYQEIRDQRFKALLLPPSEARIAEKQPTITMKPAELLPFATVLAPFLYTSTQASACLERRVAALRLVEALRLHAMQNDGKLPAKLEEITVVTTPDDPTTGRPFLYRLDNNTATIESPRSAAGVPDLSYKVTLRK